MSADPLPPTIEWLDGVVRLIDQRRLPGELVLLECRTVDELCDAIRTLVVRGAPALGAAGAMGIALAAARGEPLDAAAERLRATRPTAVNLAWGVGRALAAPDPAARPSGSPTRTSRATAASARTARSSSPSGGASSHTATPARSPASATARRSA